MIYVVLIFSVLLITVLIVHVVRSAHLKDKTKISFRESLDLTGLPVITFYNNSNKYNFLFDTGANQSVINEKDLEGIQHTVIENAEGEVYGMEGNTRKVKFAKINLTLKDMPFEEVFQIVDMTAAFNSIKQESGVTISGILGNSFLQKYKYVIDFKDFVAYCK